MRQRRRRKLRPQTPAPTSVIPSLLHYLAYGLVVGCLIYGITFGHLSVEAIIVLVIICGVAFPYRS
jgi:hypothetical protein